MDDLNAKMRDVMGPVAEALKNAGLAREINPYWIEDGKVAQCNIYVSCLDHASIGKYLGVCQITGSNVTVRADHIRQMVEVSLTRKVSI
jgi:hypothetical protein